MKKFILFYFCPLTWWE